MNHFVEKMVLTIIVSRVLYQCMKIHLFRGSVSAKANTGPENSRMVSIALMASCASAKLQKEYSQLYGARGTIAITYDAFQSVLITLYFLDFAECKGAFIQCSKTLSRFGRNRTMSAFQLWMVGLLAKREGIPLPEEVTKILSPFRGNQDQFDNLMSVVPLPATSGGTKALQSYKEKLSEKGFAKGTSLEDEEIRSQPSTLLGGIKAVSQQINRGLTISLDEIDPVLGSLTEVYRSWTFSDSDGVEM